jgi:hypothetical protein
MESEAVTVQKLVCVYICVCVYVCVGVYIYIKVKVKFTLEQATGTQKGGRSIALLFLHPRR